MSEKGFLLNRSFFDLFAIQAIMLFWMDASSTLRHYAGCKLIESKFDLVILP